MNAVAALLEMTSTPRPRSAPNAGVFPAWGSVLAVSLTSHLLLCVHAVAATVSVKSAKVNDTNVRPADSIAILPGDTIECDAYMAGWADDLQSLDAYELGIDSTGLVNTQSGALRPVCYDGPMPLFNLCTSDDACIASAFCDLVRFLCRPSTCRHVGCPPGQFCNPANWCSKDIEYPPQGSPEVGVYVATDRSDYVFLGLAPFALASIGMAPDNRLGGTPLGAPGIPDPGIPKYAGSFVFRATVATSTDMEACGTFRVSFLAHPYHTFLTEPLQDNGDPGHTIVPDMFSLAVDVDCNAPAPRAGDCNRDGSLTLAEHRHLAECFDGRALSGTCGCLDMNDDGGIDLRDFAGLQDLLDSRE